MEQHRLALCLEELEGADQRPDVVPVDGAVIAQAQVLEEHAGNDQVLDPGLHLVGQLDGALAGEPFDEVRRLLVEVGIGWMRGDPVEVMGDCADVLGDGPFVVVEHDDEALGRGGHVVERLVGDAAGEGGIAGDGNHVFIGAGLVAAHGHAQGRGERRAGVAGAVAVVVAFGAQQEAVEAAILAHGLEALAAPGKELVDVTLVAHVEDELVLRGVEDAVERDGQFDHSEVRPEMASHRTRVILGEDADEFFAHFLGEDGQVFFVEFLNVRRGIDLVEKTHGLGLLRKGGPGGRHRCSFAYQKFPASSRGGFPRGFQPSPGPGAGRRSCG